MTYREFNYQITSDDEFCKDESFVNYGWNGGCLNKERDETLGLSKDSMLV